MSTIALITDLGHANWFAGELKGVIMSLNPRAVIVDLTHSIPRSGLREGAFALLASYRSFPEDTVFLAAVDYGSSQTRVIAAKTASHVFVAPDNGVLSWALRREGAAEIREVDAGEYLVPSGCATFPARDLLAPLAAALSDWLEFERCGEIVNDYVKLDWPEVSVSEKTISTEIVYIDTFGNAITAVSPRDLSEACGESAVCTVSGVTIPARSHYGDVPLSSPVAYPGSAGLMEIGVNGGSAAELLKLKTGDVICFAG